jgi:UDP-GlcNAc:undecaprenyl-phosphate/decaprenyl-phosphate GlcNAc-1-phosphate transferase
MLSAMLTYCVRRWAIRTGFVAKPREDRFHKTITALGGGIAIFWTIAIILIGGLLIVKFGIASGRMDWLGENITIHAEGFMNKSVDLTIVVGCALVLHLVGLWDDKKNLGPMFKLVVQFAVAAVAVFAAGIRVEFFIHNIFITGFMSMFWIVLIMNSFNFMDNMDGLSAGIAAIASAVLFSAAMMSGQMFIGALALIFIGALLGFLVFNFPPARIFMGDCGSLVIGFFTAVITLRTTYHNPEIGSGKGAIFMPLIVMAVPLYDFITVTLLRISQGKSPFVGDTQHFSHRLKRRGLNDTQVALTLYLATLCTGTGAIILQRTDFTGAVLVFVQTLMVLSIIAILEKNNAKNNTE